MTETVQQIQIGSGGQWARREVFAGGKLEVLSPKGVHGPDRALLDAFTVAIEGRVLVVGTREALAALGLARLFPGAEVHLFTLDAFELHRAREALQGNGANGIQCHLAADLPEPGSFDWVILGVPHAGDAMLAGELIREAHGALKPRGKILAATDNSRDRWLHDRIIEAFGAATIHLRAKHGMAYIARKRPDHAPRDRDVRREFQASLFGQALKLGSRPGVFAHGKLDDGTLALSEVAEVEETSRVIDMGCGTGALGIAAALACPRGLAVLADSSARAVRCAIANARRNAAERNVLVVLTHDFAALRSRSLDAALANPPYFGDFRIAEHFAREALRILVPGGRFWLVTKAPERPLEIARGLFGAAVLTERRGYAIIGARKRG